MAHVRWRPPSAPKAATLAAWLAAALVCPAVVRAVTVSNTALPVDTDGQRLITGEVDIVDGKDGYLYFYMSNWGCCRQTNCCDGSGRPWPQSGCWKCCPAQKRNACTYAGNHTIVGYRTPDLATWENLGVLIGVDARPAGTVFVPRVIQRPTDGMWVMWFEDYNATDVGAAGSQGTYAVALGSTPAGPFHVVLERASFACSGAQGDFDLFTDDDGTSYIVVTHYSSMCIERLDASGTRGTGETASLPAMDVHIAGHPPGDEAPTMFKRGGTYYVLYASGCCGCKGGSITWAFTAPRALGPWTLMKNLTPAGPVTKAQQRAVFRIGDTFVHVGNNWVPGNGGAGTCTNGGLLYFWPLEFFDNGTIADIEYRPSVDINVSAALHSRAERAVQPACDDVVPLPHFCGVNASTGALRLSGKWQLAANLSSPDSMFATQAVRSNLTQALPGLDIALVDVSAANLTSPKLIVLGEPLQDERIAAVATARGGAQLMQNLSTRAESYTVTVAPATSIVFLLGGDATGSFYAAQTLFQLVRGSSTGALPELFVFDRPDTPIRGYEVEEAAGIPMQQWFSTVADVMASLKLNYVLLEAGVPMSFNYTTDTWTMPSDAEARQWRAVMAYFSQRHITVALVVGAKWDPRTLEGKYVQGEPFEWDDAGVARPLLPVETGEPLNGDFEEVDASGAPKHWLLQRGSTSGQVPCRLDRHNGAPPNGTNSIACDVQVFPDPDPFPPEPLRHGITSVAAEPVAANYSGPLTSEPFAVRGGSMYEMTFQAAWRGNWSGAFTATVSLFQYEYLNETLQDENPTNPIYPSTMNFIPCPGGDARHCGAGIPRLPNWGTFHTTFMTMPSARYVRVRSFVSEWGAGQWWLDNVKMQRLDGQLKNVVRVNGTDVEVRDATTGRLLTIGLDYTIEDPPAAFRLDPAGNFSRLQPLTVRRVDGGSAPQRVNLSYNILPGTANRIVGGRDVSCYVEPRYFELLSVAVNWVATNLRPPWIMADGFDEQMGMGRDSRTLASGLTNGEILGRAINQVNTIVKEASDGASRLVIWADMVVRDHNGGINYSWLNGAGRRQPYWPAIEQLDRDVLLLSWIYTEDSYAKQLMRDDPDYFANFTNSSGAASPWVGCGWTDSGNIELWATAVRLSQERYGAASSAMGLMCTNWGGGRLEAGLVPTAAKAWNLAS